MKDPRRLCPGCMNEWAKPDQPCPVCGFIRNKYERAARWLPLYTVLERKIMIGKVIGEGGFGITYMGWDLNLEVRVAVKEYFPMGLATRETGQGRSCAISALPGARRDNYRQGLEKFMAEAQNLSKFYNLNGIVSVRDFFFANETAYMVMEYVDGVTLGAYLKNHGGRLSEQEVLTLLHPVMDSLKTVHASGIIHRDISPDNIMMTKDGRMKLIDFGAARFAGGNNERSLTIILKHGYAPAEQYQSRGNQGPWTDVYAICATMYRMITGEVPPGAMDRLHEDTLKEFKELGCKVSTKTAYALLDKGMAIRVQDRYQSMDELMEGLYGADHGRIRRKKKLTEKQKRLYIGVGAAAGGLCAVLLFWGILQAALPGGGQLPAAGTAVAGVDSAETAAGTAGMEPDGAGKTGSAGAQTGGMAASGQPSVDWKELEQLSAEELSEKQAQAKAAADGFAAAGWHLLSRKEDGTVTGGGTNHSGELEVGNWQDIASLSTGPNHTVGVKTDGTAVATGDTSDGKCAVDIWKNIVQASAGGTMTLGLHEDGTVTAAGSNAMGQCDVSGWSGVVQTAAGESHSLGLREDGTVEAAGDDSAGQCSGVQDWSGIVRLAAHGNVSAGFKEDGTVVLCGEADAMQEALSWKGVADIALGDGYIAGLLANGQVVTAGDTACLGAGTAGWSDIAAVAAGEGALFGLRADGSIVRTTYTCGTVSRENFTDLKKVVSGGGWLLGLREDGTVISWGVSGGLSGQTDVADWTDIADIAACDQAAIGVKTDGTVLVTGGGPDSGAAGNAQADRDVNAEDGSSGSGQTGAEEDWLEEIASWTGITQAAITDGIAVGLKEDGTVMSAAADGTVVSGTTAGFSEWTQIGSIAAGNGEIVGVRSDGTVLSNRRTLSVSGAQSAAVGGDYVATVLSDGTVDVSGISGGAANVYSWKDIVQTAAGAEHTVGLKSDGTVVAAGANENGQCEIGSWTDVAYIAAGDYYTIGVKNDGSLLIAGKLPGEF